MVKRFDFKSWWSLHGADVNAKRRAAYRQDPQYRDDKKKEFREHYRRARRNMTPVDRRTVVSGSGRLYLTIGRVARIIRRDANSIRRYHKMGVIPEPRFYDSRGWRLYTPSQADFMRRVFERLDNPENTSVRSLTDVRRLLDRRWVELSRIEEVTSG